MISKTQRRVVVSGMGILSAIGQSLPEFETHLFAGACGIQEVDLFDLNGYSCRLAGQIKGENLARRLPSRHTKRISRCDILGLLATQEAMKLADVDLARMDPGRVGVVMGGGAGGMLSWENFRRRLLRDGISKEASRVLASAPCTLTDLIANHYGINGLRTTITTACSSSANAIGYGYDLIQSGHLDCVVTGGSEALSELTFAGFNSLKVMSPEPCRPFDLYRRGLSLGEGAGILFLEAYEHALQRKAPLLAEILGYALNADAHHMTSPDPKGLGMAHVMTHALQRAHIATKEVDYINAHGTATKINDHLEALAIENVFGAEQLKRISVSATKSMVGHCLGASGAIEAVATVLALQRQTAPPTANLQAPDPQCRLRHVTAPFHKQDIQVALSNSFAFGGNNTSLVFRALDNE